MSTCFEASLASWPGHTPMEAMKKAASADVSGIGRLSLGHVQICPQNRGRFSKEDALALKAAWPDSRFRLHANVRLEGAPWSPLIDASTLGNEDYYHYYMALWDILLLLKAPAYTWHAGRRENASLDAVLWNTRSVEDALGIHVGVEGMYPTKGDKWLLSTWAEYQALLESKTHYAIDLSHLNILAHQYGREDGLTRELLASEYCIEVHVSGNDGMADRHEPIDMEIWWWPMLENIGPNAVVFYEGNEVRL